jgi:hypothetical protein
LGAAELGVKGSSSVWEVEEPVVAVRALETLNVMDAVGARIAAAVLVTHARGSDGCLEGVVGCLGYEAS